MLVHSPANGIGIKRSTDLVNWYDECLYTLGQRQWPWAQGRITAGHLLDLRSHPAVGKYLLTFHGATRRGRRERTHPRRGQHRHRLEQRPDALELAGNPRPRTAR